MWHRGVQLHIVCEAEAGYLGRTHSPNPDRGRGSHISTSTISYTWISSQVCIGLGLGLGMVQTSSHEFRSVQVSADHAISADHAR